MYSIGQLCFLNILEFCIGNGISHNSAQLNSPPLFSVHFLPPSIPPSIHPVHLDFLLY